MKRKDYIKYSELAFGLYEKAGIVLTEDEKNRLEIADFGLNDYEKTGLAIVTYVNTARCCAKELALLPSQICPEHTHVSVPSLNYEGKEETFRCRYGTVYLYTEEGKNSAAYKKGEQDCEGEFTASHKIVLHEGEQHTLFPNTKHWFQAGSEGAVVSEFSTRSLDEYDMFTDQNIVRIPQIEE